MQPPSPFFLLREINESGRLTSFLSWDYSPLSNSPEQPSDKQQNSWSFVPVERSGRVRRFYTSGQLFNPFTINQGVCSSPIQISSASRYFLIFTFKVQIFLPNSNFGKYFLLNSSNFFSKMKIISF